MRVKCICSYDGSSYNGYQRQPGTKTIQGTIEEVLIGFKVEDNKKLKYAMKFAREANETTIKENDLKCNKICNKKSNFLEVLEEIIRQ